jgi:O-antigen/teichoic acid export membrane protein
MAARKRFIGSLAAQIYGQISGIVIQLALVPVLIHAWGTTLYGTWLLLSAVPFYLTFSDFGFTFIAKNEMVMAVASGNRQAAVRTFQSIFVMLAMALPVVFAVMAGPSLLLDLSGLLSLRGYHNDQARQVFVVLVANVALYQFLLLLCAGIRAENRPATEASLAATSRLTEGLLIGAAALSGQGLLGAALAALVNRVVFLGVAYLTMRRLSPWLTLGWAEARWSEIKRLFHPALAYMFMPLAQAVMIQGPVLVIGNLADPAAVVVFSTSRTLARLGTAGTNVLTNAFVTEYAARAGKDDVRGFAALFRGHLLLALAGIAAYALGILALDDRLMLIFTHGKVAIVEPFFAIIVGGVAAEMLWTTFFTPISAVNRHRTVTYAYFVLCFAGIVACYPLVRHFGIAGAGLFVLGVNALMIPLNLALGRPARLLDGHAERLRAAFAAG